MHCRTLRSLEERKKDSPKKIYEITMWTYNYVLNDSVGAGRVTGSKEANSFSHFKVSLDL